MKLLISILILFVSVSIFSQTPSKTLPTAKELLEMDLDKTYPIIETLTKEESKELISQIRKEVKNEFKQADHFYFLISHLEEIQAIEKEQARLRSLLWVLGLGFVLFFAFLTYIFFSQRRAIRDINQMLEK